MNLQETLAERLDLGGIGPSHAELGAGVAGILDAAEQAAEKIRADAQNEAAALIRSAEEGARARVRVLTAEAERAHAEAEAQGQRIVMDAEAAAADLRIAAEAYSERLRRDADEEVSKAERIRARAREEASEIVRQSHETAELRIAELVREPERLRDEAAAHALAVRTAADDYASAERRRAEEDASERWRSAEEQARLLVATAQEEARNLAAAAQRDARRVEDESRRREEAASEDVRNLKQVRDDAAAAMLDVVAALREAAQRVESEVVPLVAPDSPREVPLERPGFWARLFGRKPAPAPSPLAALDIARSPAPPAGEPETPDAALERARVD